MAGDWIKMRTGLLTNPKVIRMARLLAENEHFMGWWTRGTKVSCDETVYELCDVTVVTRVTVGSLLSVWGAVNDCASQEGFVKGISLFEVDEMAGVPGFGAAMCAVGWVEETENGLVFPNFHEHNTVEKQRSTGAKTGSQRTKEYRERKKAAASVTSDVTVTSQRDHREEKRREEEKKEKKRVTQSVTLPAFVPADAWDGFVEMRKKIKKPMTDRAVQLMFAKLGRFADAGHDIRDCLERSTLNNWQDVFEPKPSQGSLLNGSPQPNRFAGAK